MAVAAATPTLNVPATRKPLPKDCHAWNVCMNSLSKNVSARVAVNSLMLARISVSKLTSSRRKYKSSSMCEKNTPANTVRNPSNRPQDRHCCCPGHWHLATRWPMSSRPNMQMVHPCTALAVSSCATAQTCPGRRHQSQCKRPLNEQRHSSTT